MNKLFVLPLLVLALTGPALTQQKVDAKAAHAGAASAPAAAEMTEGEIRKIDKAAGTVTIQHAEIKNLGMPPMTMVFKAKSAALLDRAKPGEKIRFTAEQGSGGALIVTDIQPAKNKP